MVVAAGGEVGAGEVSGEEAQVFALIEEVVERHGEESEAFWREIAGVVVLEVVELGVDEVAVLDAVSFESPAFCTIAGLVGFRHGEAGRLDGWETYQCVGA